MAEDEVEEVQVENSEEEAGPEEAEESAAEPDAAAEDSGESDKPSSEDKSGEERRKAYRLNKVLGATLTSTDGDATKTRLFVIDISGSGFRATDHQPPSEDECEISIALVKGEDPFVSRMRVVWVKELTVSGMYQMGCEFIETAEAEQAKLDGFIDQERNRTAEAAGGKPTIKIDNPWTMI
ncbi:MAG: PilZ domain-containing protein [Candidatus Eremiobacteraeota bacterium]|nr:PilZ domain-containing protein [Candidatus Eremiobacteraeota bacterium]